MENIKHGGLGVCMTWLHITENHSAPDKWEDYKGCVIVVHCEAHTTLNVWGGTEDDEAASYREHHQWQKVQKVEIFEKRSVEEDNLVFHDSRSN